MARPTEESTPTPKTPTANDFSTELDRLRQLAAQSPVQGPAPNPPANEWLKKDQLPVKATPQKPRPADAWTTELDRLRAQGAAAVSRPVAKLAQQPKVQTEEPQREAYKPKPVNPFRFFEEGSDAWGRSYAAQIAERSTSDVLREREIESSGRVTRESYIRSYMLPSVGKTVVDPVDPWDVTAVTSAADSNTVIAVSTKKKNEFQFTTEGRPLFTESAYPAKPVEPAELPDYSGRDPEEARMLSARDEFMRRESEFEKWFNSNPYSAVVNPNPFEKAILRALPRDFANFALMSAYEFDKMVGRTNQSSSQSPLKFNVDISQSLTTHGMAQAVTGAAIQFAFDPDARDRMSKVVAEQIQATNAIAGNIVNSYKSGLTPDVYAIEKRDLIARLLLEDYNVKEYERLLARGYDLERARDIMHRRVSAEVDAYLHAQAINVAIADNGKDIVGATLMAIGAGWNTYWGGFEGGEAIVDASVAVVSALNYLGVYMDSEWRRPFFGTDYSAIQLGGMAREAIVAGASPMFKETPTGYAFQVATRWEEFSPVFVAAGSRMSAAWNGAAAEIQKYSADNVNAQYQLAIDDYEETHGELSKEIERIDKRLAEIGGVPKDKKEIDEQRQLSFQKANLELLAEIKEKQIASLKDVMYSGVASTVDDLELRWQNALDRIASVERAGKYLEEAYAEYAEVFSVEKQYENVPFTPQQKRERDEKLLRASQKYAEAMGMLEESPLRMFDRAYTNERFLFDILAPSFLLDGGGKFLSLFGITKSAAASRIERAAEASGVAETIGRAATVEEIANVSSSLHKAYSQAQDLVHKSRVATSEYAVRIAEATGIDPARFVGKSIYEIDKIVKTESKFPALGKEINDARRIAESATKKAERAVIEHANRYAGYENLLQAHVEEMHAKMMSEIKAASDIAESTEKLRPGRQSPLSTLYRSSKSAATAVVNETHRAFVDVFMHVRTKEDALQILSAMKNPEEFLKGIDGQWSSPVLFKATNGGADKLVFNADPWKGKYARRGLAAISKRMDDFIDYLKSDILDGTGEFNANLLMQEFDDFVEWSFAQDTWAKGAKAKIPFGVAGAKVGTSKNGGPRLQYIDRNGKIIREVMAPDLTTAKKLADEINKGARGENIKQSPIEAIGRIKRSLLAVPFIGWNPANLIQQFMHPVINSIFRVDGVNSTGVGRWGIRTLDQIEKHVEKLFGTENPTRRHGATDFAQSSGLGVSRERTLLEKIAKPLGPLYVWVEEGSGKQFYYDAAMKFIQKYGRTVADRLLRPNLIAEGVDPVIAKRAANVFYDVAYREGFEAGAKAALDVIDGNITRYTMSDFDPNWASWMHPDVARRIEDVLNSSTSIADIDSRIADIVRSFDDAMQEFDVTTQPTGSGTRHAFTQADLLQDAAELTQEATNAKNNAPKALRPKINAELQQTLDSLKRTRNLLQGLVAQISKNENLPNVGNAFYHVWKAMRDGRTNIAMRANELAEAIHLAGGKQKWATDYWPQVNKMWLDYYKEMESVIARTKEAIDNGGLDSLTRPEDLIVEHSRHTDEYLINQLKINPGSGLYDESLKIVMDAARAIERNQQSNFASVAQRSGSPWARVFDEAVSAERDIAMRKIEIRGELNRLAEETRKAFESTGDGNVWNQYYTQRNAMWRSLFSEYVPARWMEATKNLLGNRSETILNEIIARFGNVTPERAAEIANTIRTTLKPDALPPTRVVSPSAKMTGNAFAIVDRAALFDEMFQVIDAAEGDAFIVRTPAGRVVSISTSDIDPMAKKITVNNRTRDVATIRMIEDANGNVLWDADSSPTWNVAYEAAQKGPSGGVQSGAPQVLKALAGIENPAIGSVGVGWLDGVAAVNPRMARHLLMRAFDELSALHPNMDFREAIDLLMQDVKNIGDRYRGDDLRSFPGDLWYAELDGARASLTDISLPEAIAKELNDLLDNAFMEEYGRSASDAFANIPVAGLDVVQPQVNRANIAQKIAKSFGVPDEMADSFAQVVDAYAKRVAEMWFDQEGLANTRFATREEYIDAMTDRWYEDSLVDIVYSGKGSGVSGVFDAVAQTEYVGANMADMRSLIRTMDRMLDISDESQRLRVAAHELSHVFHLDMMKQAARGNERASELIIALWEHLNDDVYRPGQMLEWTTDSMERFAGQFERWLETGVAKVPALQPLFEKFVQWLKGTFALYEDVKRWIETTPVFPGSTRTKAYVRNVGYQFINEILGGEKANVPTLAERAVDVTGKPVNVPNVGKAPKTVPDIAYMNMIRKTAKDVFPELAEALDGIKSLKDVPPHLMPLVQQMADIYAMRKKLAIAKSAKDVAKASDLEKAIDSAVKVHSQYSPEFRSAIRDGDFWSNANPNRKSPTPNTSALYSIEQLQNMRARIVNELYERSRAAQRADSPRPYLPSSDVPTMPPDVRLKASTYLYNTFRKEWDKVMHGANVAGDAMRSFTMVDFWNRTRADDFLQLISPFPFWSTRDIKNGFERMLRNPGFVWHMDRIDQSLERAFNAYAQQQEDENNSIVPQRYSNKMGIFGGGWLPEWAQNFIPAGENGEKVPIAVFWPVGLSRFFPTNTVRLRDAIQSGRKVDTGNAFMDFANVGIMSGISFDPWINEYLSMQSGNQSQWRMSDWTVQTRTASWSALGMMHPKDWEKMPIAARPDWFEYTVARELENMTQRGIITDRMTLGLAMDFLYSMYNKGKEFDSPEWQNATPVQREAVWNALIAARDAAIAKVQVQSGTGILTGFPVYLYDTAEGRTNWEQSVRRRLYYDPERNPLGTNEAANLYTTQNLSLQASDMQGKIMPIIDTRGGWVPDNQVTPRTPRPVVLASTSQRREDMLNMDERIMELTSSAVSSLLKKKPSATSSEINAAKVEALIPMAREILGDEAVDKWLEEQKKGLKKDQKVTYYGGLITLMREEIAKETPSAYTERSNTGLAPEGTPRRYMQDNLAHGSPFSTLPEKAETYNKALAEFPSPVNPDILRSNHTVAAVELVVDLYKYPEYGSTKTAREYAQKAQGADKKREEHLAKLLRITVEQARDLLDQYKYRYMGEDEIARRKQIESQGYSSSGGGRYYPQRMYSRGGRRSRGGYSRSSWGSGGSWGGGGGAGSGTSETDLLPSIESYIRRKELSGYLWTRPRSRYAVR